MTGIGKVDQIVLQLRAELQKVANRRARAKSGAARAESSPLERFRTIEGIERHGDQELRRKFIRALLTEELGEELANQPEFERISDDVWRLLEEEPELRVELEQALVQLSRN
jgi:hypothetical protein